MRVVGGSARGRKLVSPHKKAEVRPTLDRVKESVFSSIQHLVPESTVIDLYAGAGTLGIEALSRYADKAYFVDCSTEQIQLVKKNLQITGFERRAELICQHVETAIRYLNLNEVSGDIIFLDPPYGTKLAEKTLTWIDQSRILAVEGIIIVEHDINEILPDHFQQIECYKDKKYGTTRISFYQLREEQENEKSHLSRQL